MSKSNVLKTTFSLAGKVDGSLNKAIKSASSNTSKAAKGMSKSMSSNMSGASKAMTKSLKGFASSAIKVFGMIKAVTKLKQVAQECITAAKAQIEVETKLESVLSNVESIQIRGPNAYKESARVLKNVASEMQSVGVIGDEVTIAGMQQLATFQLSEKEISVLSSGMGDLLAQQKGLNATQGDAVTIGNMIGKAMNGQVGALSKVGISFTEAQANAIKTGDATLRAATIADVLKQNVGGVNEALADTDQGKIQQATNILGDMKEQVGMYLLPLLAKLTKNVMPFVQTAFEKVCSVFDRLSPVISDLISKGFNRFKEILPTIVGLISEIVPVVLQLIGPMKEFGQQLLPIILDTISQLMPTIQGVVQSIVPLISQIAANLLPLIQKLQPILIKLVNAVLPVIADLLNEFAPIFFDLLDALIPVVDEVISALIPAFTELIKPVKEIIKAILPPLVTLIKQLAPIFAQIISSLAPLITQIVNALLPAFNIIIPPIMNLVNTLLPPLMSIIGGILGFVQSLAPLIQVVATLFSTSLAVAIQTVTPIIETCAGVLDSIISVLTNIIDFVVNVFTGNWEGAWQNLSDIVVGIFDGLKGVLRGALQIILAPVNGIIDGLNEVSSWIPGWDGFNIPNIEIPEFANGGTLRKATLLIAGEAGPETIVPHNNKPRSRALLQEAAAGVGMGVSGSGGNTFVYNPVVYANDVQGVQSALEDDYERFKAYLSQYKDEQEREEF